MLLRSKPGAASGWLQKNVEPRIFFLDCSSDSPGSWFSFFPFVFLSPRSVSALPAQGTALPSLPQAAAAMGWEGAGAWGKAAFGHPLVAPRADTVPFRLPSNIIEPYKREAEPQVSAANGQRVELGTQEAKDFFAWLLKAKKNQR